MTRKADASLAKLDADFGRSLSRASAVKRVNALANAYATSRNGLLLWRALAVAHRSGEPIPPALLDRFCEFHERLERALSRKGETARAIVAALQLRAGSGANTAAENADAAVRRWIIAEFVGQQMRGHRTGTAPPMDVLQRAADVFKCKPSEARKLYYKMVDRLEVASVWTSHLVPKRRRR